MDIVLDLLWHGEDNNVLDVIEVQTFGCDTRRYHYVLRTRFEGFDGVLAFFLACGCNVGRKGSCRRRNHTFGAVDSNGFDTFEE
jgi:hypothetical protein